MMVVGGILSEQNQNLIPIAFVGVALAVLGGLALIATQIYLLVTRSQTIGKYFLKTQIVDFNTGVRSDFVQCFLIRSLLNGVIGAVPCLGAIYGIVDICFIFREDKRCIHDLMAKTCVIDIS